MKMPSRIANIGMQPLFLMAGALCHMVIIIHEFYNVRNIVNQKCPSLHAEIHAIHRLSKRIICQRKSLKKYSIIVIRIHKITGQLMNSKPCHNCIESMKKCGIKTVYYSNLDGDIVMERVNKITNCQSSGFRWMKSRSGPN